MQLEENNFEEIYQDTYNRVLRFIVVKCNDIDYVNDIKQNKYIKFLKILKKKNIIKIDNINNYILGIANNIIKRHYYKKKNNIITFVKEEEIEIKDDIDLEQDFITKENVKKVWEYIKGKDILTSKIFYLYFVLELKISEIATELRIKESTVKNRLYRTLKEVKKYIGKDVISNE